MTELNFLWGIYVFMGVPSGSPVKNLPTIQERQETRVRSLGGEDPLEEEMAAPSSILIWRVHGQRSLVGYDSWGRKEWDTTDVTANSAAAVHLHSISLYHKYT